jgi:3-oxoacyl-[acyl-carrier-protein] synthase II
MNERRRVVITGMGTFNPLGHDVAETWAAVRHGRSGIAPITSFDCREMVTKFAGEVKAFDPVAHFGRREARRMDRVAQLAAAAANQAIGDANLQITVDNRERIGVVLGSGIGGIGSLAENMATLAEKGPSRISPFMVPMMLTDTAAGLIAIHHDLRGPNMAVVTACASSNNALGEAARMIRHGVVDTVIGGGAESCLIPIVIAGFNVMGALSTRNEEPQRASRPFDQDRDGFVPGEGAAILVMEELEQAQARGAKIYAEFLGYGSSADAYHISAPAENGTGAVLSMRLALADAGLNTGDIDWISAHGTGTPLNDRSETAAIKSLFGERAYAIPVSSTKSMHGHLMGAAGALEAVIGVQALVEDFIPPTINYETPDPNCDLDYVPNNGRSAPLNIIMSNSFGFGGHNATIILAKWPRAL